MDHELQDCWYGVGAEDEPKYFASGLAAQYPECLSGDEGVSTPIGQVVKCDNQHVGIEVVDRKQDRTTAQEQHQIDSKDQLLKWEVIK